MSETLTFANGAQARIYGSTAGALAYLGAETTEWDDVATDEALQRLLVRAGRLLDDLPWNEDYEAFEARDGLDLGSGDGDAAFPFRAASYLIADAGLLDETILISSPTGDVTSMSAGSTSITTRTGASESALDRLPSRVLDLIGDYLTIDDGLVMGGYGAAGSSCNPFSTRRTGRTGGW